jgi:NTE family protein
MLSSVIDVFRLRQYFDVATRARQWAQGIGEDAGLLADVRRAMLPLPFDRASAPDKHPFPSSEPFTVPRLKRRRLAVLATGGSGALASVVGVGRALEEAGIRPEVFSLCSGSALFGFPLAAGVPAREVAEFVLSLQPRDYVDLDWGKLASLVPSGARGFAGLLVGERIEALYRRLLGDMTLAQMPVPAYAPIWNIEANRVEYIGPRTYPDMTVAHAVHMAISLPLFVAPVWLDGTAWCDGGLVDIFPVRPLLDIEEPCDVTLAVNGFYPPGFAGEDATGWQDQRVSILYIASQVRTSQQAELARVNLDRLNKASDVVMIEPVAYSAVKGVGFYRQFLSQRDWPQFMCSGRLHARRALRAEDRRLSKTARSA